MNWKNYYPTCATVCVFGLLMGALSGDIGSHHGPAIRTIFAVTDVLGAAVAAWVIWARRA